jgi:demethylmenaquinone methyltransferase/2-methoxy-6-polyprenyl-1,4-benzoquinol methylase
MISVGKKRLKNYKNINWNIGNGEKLKFKDNTFDYYTISFGIRNVSNINKALSEAFRVLRPGGRFMCLEFSKIQNSYLDKIYQLYSKNIPKIGKFIVGDNKPYNYLISSIEDFYNQDELLELIKKNKFYKSEYRNLSGGVVAIHSAWKV